MTKRHTPNRFEPDGKTADEIISDRAGVPTTMRSIVRENLLTVQGYTPYCGNVDCSHGMPRTVFSGHQFYCLCGWVSSYEPEFICDYKAKWKWGEMPHAEGRR